MKTTGNLNLTAETVSSLEESVIGTLRKVQDLTSHYWKQSKKENDNKYGYMTEKVNLLNDIVGKIKNRDLRIGVFGEQSCGKSFLLNTLLGFPLLPMANLVTSSVPVRITYGEKCKIKIYYNNGKEECAKDIDCSDIADDMLNTLKEYVCKCANAMGLENIRYFTQVGMYPNSINCETLQIDVGDERHIAFLWLSLLAAYVNQNEDKEVLNSEQIEAVNKREEIFDELGLEMHADYLVEIAYNSSLLHEGLTLIDLPGLGSTVKQLEVNSGIIKSHDEIAKDAIRETDMMLFVFDPTVKDIKLSNIMGILLSLDAYKRRKNVKNSILIALNKIDGSSATIDKSKSKIATLFNDYDADLSISKEDIIGVSAKAGEYNFCKVGNIPFECTAYKYIEKEDGLSRQVDNMREYYDTMSNLDELKNKLVSFSLNGRFGLLERLFKHLVEYCRKLYLQTVEDELKNYKLSYTSYDDFSEDILNKIEILVGDTFANARDALEKLLSQVFESELAKIKKATQTDIRNDIYTKLQPCLNDISKRINRNLNDMEKSLPLFAKNPGFRNFSIFGWKPFKKTGGITLENKGQKTEMAAILKKIEGYFLYPDFSSVEEGLLKTIENATQEIETVTNKMTDDVVKQYTALNSQFNEMMDNTFNAAEENSDFISSSKFATELRERCESIIKTNSNIADDLSFTELSDEVINAFTNCMLEQLSLARGTLNNVANEINSIVYTGFFEKERIQFDELKNTIQNYFVVRDITDTIIENITGTFGEKIENFTNDATFAANPIIFQPIETMEELTKNMNHSLRENKGADKQTIEIKIRSLYENDYTSKVNDIENTVYDLATDMNGIDDGCTGLENTKWLNIVKDKELNSEIKSLLQ